MMISVYTPSLLGTRTIALEAHAQSNLDGDEAMYPESTIRNEPNPEGSSDVVAGSMCVLEAQSSLVGFVTMDARVGEEFAIPTEATRPDALSSQNSCSSAARTLIASGSATSADRTLLERLEIGDR